MNEQRVFGQRVSRRALLTGLASIGALSAGTALLAACKPMQPTGAPMPDREQQGRQHRLWRI